MDRTVEEKIKMLKRIEFGKQHFKKRFEDILNSLGVFDVEKADYPELQLIVRMCDIYFKKHGISEFDINKLPNKLKQLLITKYYRAVNKRINTLSEESKIFFMVDVGSETFRINDKVETKTIDEVIQRWTKYIILGIVSGYMGKGKTDFSLKIAEWMYRMGAIDYIVSNIRLSGSSVYNNVYYEISTLSELIIFLYEYRDKSKIFVFDEAGIHVSHRRAMKTNNILMMHLSRLIRKLKCHVLLITQDASGVDKSLRDLATLYIHKETKTTAQVIENFDERETYMIVDIQPTNIPYDTNDMADFIFDLTVDDLIEIMKLISENPTINEFKEKINEMVEKYINSKKDNKKSNIGFDESEAYINEHINSDTVNGAICDIYQSQSRKQEESIEVMILRYIYETGRASARDIANYISKSRSRTNEYLRELIDCGLICREGKGKKIIYRLTPAGQYFLKKGVNLKRKEVFKNGSQKKGGV